VFTSEFGAHWHPCTPTSVYADVRLQADLPTENSLHDLRHSLASAMLKRGMSAKHVQSQLGHSKIHMTLGAYSHLMPGERTGISNVMADFIAEGKRTLDAKRAAAAPSRVH
jgi:integrase